MSRGSSRRLMDLPNMRSSVALAMAIPSLARLCRLLLGSGHRVGGPLDGLHDVVVPRAAAQVAFELVPDLLFGGLGVPLEHLVSGHDHARGAEPALQAVLLPEPLLDRMQ